MRPPGATARLFRTLPRVHPLVVESLATEAAERTSCATARLGVDVSDGGGKGGGGSSPALGGSRRLRAPQVLYSLAGRFRRDDVLARGRRAPAGSDVITAGMPARSDASAGTPDSDGRPSERRGLVTDASKVGLALRLASREGVPPR